MSTQFLVFKNKINSLLVLFLHLNDTNNSYIEKFSDNNFTEQIDCINDDILNHIYIHLKAHNYKEWDYIYNDRFKTIYVDDVNETVVFEPHNIPKIKVA